MKRTTIKYISIILILICVTIFPSFRMITQFRESDATIKKRLSQKGLNYQLGYYNAIGRSIRYLIIDNGAENNLIFIHGAPGSISRYNHFYEDTLLRKYYNFYAIDRPGYGYSGFGEAEVSIKKNTEAILPLFNLIKNNCGKNVVVGQSYGGLIASELAILHPELVDQLILMCPAIQPGEEKTYPISHLMVNKNYKFLFPTMYITASKEKLAHKEELEKIEGCWSQIKCPVTMIQGLNDKLVYPSNINFISTHVNDTLLSVIPLQNETHFITKKAYPQIVRSLHNAVE